MLTRASVHCADRIVAISSSSGVAEVQRAARIGVVHRQLFGNATSVALRFLASGHSARLNGDEKGDPKAAGLSVHTAGVSRKPDRRTSLASVSNALRSHTQSDWRKRGNSVFPRLRVGLV